MSENRKKARIRVRLSEIIIFIGSFILLLGPLTDLQSGGFPAVLGYIVGGLFWLSHISAYILFISAGVLRKKDELKKETKHTKKDPIGIVSFFTTKKALYADILFIISWVLAIVCMINPLLINNNIQFLIIACAVFFVQMHAILNGRIYRYAFAKKKKSRRVIKKEDEETVVS